MRLSFNRQNRKEEFEQLMREQGGRVYQLLMRMVQNSAEAEDLAQDSFVKAWDKWDTFRGEAQRSTWLISIATREALQALRKRKATYEDSEALAFLAADEISPDASELSQAIEAAIQSLPERQKAIFSLRYYEEMPFAQISETLGGTQGSLKASYHHARQKVEKIVKEQLNHEQ